MTFTLSDTSTSCQQTKMTSPVRQDRNLTNQEQRQTLDRFIEVLLKPEGRNAHNLLPFIKRTLNQFRLYSYYDEVEILLQARNIALKKIEAGEEVVNISAWLKAISFNVIRNLSKKSKRQESLINRLKNRSTLTDSKDYLIPVYATDANVKALCQAFEQLSVKERKILILREVNGFSWKEIGDRLVANKEEIENDSKLVQRLRQTGNRALKRLRKNYQSFLTNCLDSEVPLWRSLETINTLEKLRSMSSSLANAF
jgi:RNA polymerase sigma factor (sigma-70 family)